ALAGNIKDPSGAFVRAAITAIHRDNGMRRSTRSGSDGAWALPLLQPGEWRIEIEAPGFERAIVPTARVDIDQTTRIEVTLRIAGMQESAVVRSQSAPVLGEV